MFYTQVPDTAVPDLSGILGTHIQPPFKPSQLCDAITDQHSSPGLPPLPHLQQKQPQLSLEDDKDYKEKLLSIVEKPSSRGGTAFDINFDDNNGGNKKMPKALQVKVKASNFTREELQAKLNAADQHRKVQSYFSSYY